MGSLVDSVLRLPLISDDVDTATAVVTRGDDGDDGDDKDGDDKDDGGNDTNVTNVGIPSSRGNDGVQQQQRQHQPRLIFSTKPSYPPKSVCTAICFYLVFVISHNQLYLVSKYFELATKLDRL